MYHAGPEVYALVKELGCDSVEVAADENSDPEEMRKVLDQARGLGLKAIFHPAVWPFDRARVRALALRHAGHPAIAYWYLADEPDFHGAAPEEVRALADCLAREDPGTPTYTVVSPLNYGRKPESCLPFIPSRWFDIRGKAYGAYRDAADVIGVDHYGSPSKVRSHLRRHVFPKLKGRRWWAIVSLNQSPEDLRRSLATFLEGEPSGIMYYAFSESGWGFDLREHPEIQRALKEINAELRRRP